MASAAAANKCPLADQPQVRLGDRGGGVERVAGRLNGYSRGGELAQFVVEEWEQVGGGLAIAASVGFEQSGDVGRGLEYNRCRRQRSGKRAPPRRSR
jgi:hypothetical protein